MIPRGARRSVHAQRRRQHHAYRGSAYCRRLNQREAREHAREKRRSAGWWKWYWSPRQVKLRRRRAAKAERRYQAYERREKAYFAAHGLAWASYPKCPSRLSKEHKAAERKRRHARELARRRKRAREVARYNACRKALRAAGAIPPAKASKGKKAAKATRARSGRRTRKC